MNYKPVYMIDKSYDIIKRYNSIIEASKATGFDPSSITKVCKQKQKTCHGYIWQYA